MERITVAVRGETEWVDVTIRWAGGMESRHELRRPVLKYEQLSNYRALRDRVARAAPCRHVRPREIAERLNSEGFHPPNGVDQFHRDTGRHIPGAPGPVGPRDDEADKARRDFGAMNGA